MALVEEELPGVSKGDCRSYSFARQWADTLFFFLHEPTASFLCCISSILICISLFVCAVRSDFRMREDSAIAHRLQEQECKNAILPCHTYIKSYS